MKAPAGRRALMCNVAGSARPAAATCPPRRGAAGRPRAIKGRRRRRGGRPWRRSAGHRRGCTAWLPITRRTRAPCPRRRRHGHGHGHGRWARGQARCGCWAPGFLGSPRGPGGAGQGLGGRVPGSSAGTANTQRASVPGDN